MKNKKIIVGNWKMNPVGLKEAKNIVAGIKKTSSFLKKSSVIICPPAVFLGEFAKNKGKVAWGVQDVHQEESGAFTGSISAPMAKAAGAGYAIIGHSERRAAGDTDELINNKIKAAIKAKLNVILCVGEKVRDKEGNYLSALQKQLQSDLEGFLPKYSSQLLVAYEPVWAIGKNATGVETPEGFHQNMIFIRKVLGQIIGKNRAQLTPVLYGGSVNPQNAQNFLAEGQADGLLVGRDSLSVKNFSEILKIADKVK